MTVDELPQDLEVCHQLILKLAADNEKLGRRLQELLRNKYGRKSETINPDQLNLFAQEILAEFRQIAPEVTAIYLLLLENKAVAGAISIKPNCL